MKKLIGLLVGLLFVCISYGSAGAIQYQLDFDADIWDLSASWKIPDEFSAGSRIGTVSGSVVYTAPSSDENEDSFMFSTFTINYKGDLNLALAIDGFMFVPDALVFGTGNMDLQSGSLSGEGALLGFFDIKPFFDHDALSSGDLPSTFDLADWSHGGIFAYAGAELSTLEGNVSLIGGTVTDASLSEYAAPVAPVPEPATLVLFGLCLMGVLGISRRTSS